MTIAVVYKIMVLGFGCVEGSFSGGWREVVLYIIEESYAACHGFKLQPEGDTRKENCFRLA